MRQIVGPLIAAVLLSACSGPAVETAQVEPVIPRADWRTAVPQSGELDADWWRNFGDPKLTALVDQALARNPDIGIAMARIREAKAQELGAKAAMLPTLDAAAGVSESRSVNAFGQPLEQTAAQPLLQSSWEVDLFGRLSDQESAARSAWMASEAAHDAVRLSIAATVARGYVTLLALDMRLDVARQTIEARKQAVDLIRRRADVGYSPKLELAQAEADYQAVLQIFAPLEQARSRQENALRALTGQVPGEVERGSSLAALTQPAVPESLPSELLRRRPDIAQAELQLAASDYALSAARKRFLPQVRLTASAGAAFSSALADPIAIWSIGGSILAPLFEGGRLRAGAESAAAQRDAAAYAYQKTALNAFGEVENALSGIVHADELEEAVSARRDALDDAYRYASNRYREGYSPFLEQLDAQRSLLTAELNLVEAQSDAFLARIALFQALGGGWSPEIGTDSGYLAGSYGEASSGN